jgi:hypothetical protein
VRGGDYDRWDLEVRGGFLGAARLRSAVEEHGAGKQLVRFRSWPRCLPVGLVLTSLFAALSTWAALEQAWLAFAILGVPVLLIAGRIIQECAVATGSIRSALVEQQAKEGG